MNSELIEVTAVRAVENSLLQTKRAIPDFPTKDRSPAFDGSIRFYRDGSNSNENLLGCISVQIKGKVTNKTFPEKISYDIKLTDLRLYLNQLGVMYFVVCICEDTLETQIYYLDLVPARIKPILKEAKDQKTIRLHLKQFPVDDGEKIDVMLNFIDDQRNQANLINLNEINEKQLKEKGVVKGYTFGFKTVRKEVAEDPLAYLFDHPAFIYLETDLGNFAVNEMTNCQKFNVKCRQNVYAGNKHFFDHYSYDKFKTHEEYFIGNGIRIKLSYKPKPCFELYWDYKGPLLEQIKDAEFILEVLKENKISLGSNIFNFYNVTKNSKDFQKQTERHLHYLYEIKKATDLLNLTDKFNLDFSVLSDEEKCSLELLINGLLYQKPIFPPEKEESFGYTIFEIADLSILAIIKKGVKGSIIKEFNKYPLPLTINYDGKTYKFSRYLHLTEEQFCKCSNIDYACMLKEIKAFPMSEIVFHYTINTILRMLQAYDKQKIKDSALIKTTISLCKFIYNQGKKDNCINLLNFLQAKKRYGKLSKNEKKELTQIMNDEKASLMEKAAGAILLEDFGMTEFYYSQLDKNDQKAFSEFPIANLWYGKFKKEDIIEEKQRLSMLNKLNKGRKDG